MQFPHDGEHDPTPTSGGPPTAESYEGPSQRIEYDDVDSHRAISGIIRAAAAPSSSPEVRQSEEPPVPRDAPPAQVVEQPRPTTQQSASGSMMLNGVALRGANKVLSFDEAMQRYSANTECHPCFRMVY